jgi:putative N6-adenine-specific DNA methylase
MLSKAKSEIVNDTGFKIYGYDIDESAIKIARKNAKNADVSNIVSFEVQNATEFTSKEEFGVIVTNPPYGERLLDRQAIVSLYKKFGVAFKNLNNWSAYVITPVTDFERLFGVKATKKRKIYNGKIECTLYSVMGKKPQKNF